MRACLLACSEKSTAVNTKRGQMAVMCVESRRLASVTYQFSWKGSLVVVDGSDDDDGNDNDSNAKRKKKTRIATRFGKIKKKKKKKGSHHRVIVWRRSRSTPADAKPE